MKFSDEEHKKFYSGLKEFCHNDREYMSVAYLLGVSPRLREHARQIFNQDGFDPTKTGSWATDSDQRLLYLAADLWGSYCERPPYIRDLFCDRSLYPYMIQAMDIRFGFSVRKESSGRPPHYNEVDARRVIDLREKKFSIRDIADMEGMSTATVQKLLKWFK